jgi:hypothetical protein
MPKLSEQAYTQGLGPMLKRIEREEREADARREEERKAKRHAYYLARKAEPPAQPEEDYA